MEFAPFPGGVSMRITVYNDEQGIVHEEVLALTEVVSMVHTMCSAAGLPEPWTA